MKNKKTLLMILDGWGLGDGSESDVISSVPTPNIDALMAEFPHSRLHASGEDVGLPEGQMGNSEVGHLNIGAGPGKNKQGVPYRRNKKEQGSR
jgi:2,3-bisphosphoglycerate-independent phosphoglycerate mutase